MGKRQLSIRNLLVFIISGLVLLVLGLAARGVYDNLQRLSDVQSLRDASRLSDQLFDATEKLSVERDVALSMLDAPDQDSVKDLMPRLKESRAADGAALDAAMAALNRYDFPELKRLRTEIGRHLDAIRGLRSDIDGAIGLNDADLKENLRATWASEVDALMQETQDLWLVFVGHFTGTDAVATQHLLFKQQLRTITDYMGRERSLIGELISRNAKPSDAQSALLLRGQGVIATGWQTARLLADESGFYGGIALRYKDAESHYATMRDMAQSIFFEGVQKNAKVSYPIGVDLWFELSDEAADSLNSLRIVSVAVSDKYLDGRIAEIDDEILGNGVVLFLALCLCGYSFWVIVRRVIRPINTMIGALLAETEDEDTHFVSQGVGQDEIEKLQHVLASFRRQAEDIKRSSADLFRSETRLRAVIDNALDGLISLTGDGLIRRFNPACETMFGYSLAEVQDKNVRLLMTEPAEGPEGDFARAMIAGDSNIVGATRYEIIARRRNGETFPMEVSISALHLDDGLHFVGILRDITDRKEAEQELHNYNAALERSNRELDDFAYIASHDLKEPLRGIHNHSRFLLEDNEEKLDKESVGRLQRLIYLSQRMEKLVNDLLYFSRLGRQELAVQPTDLKAVVVDIESTLDNFLEERGARIVVKPMPDAVVCDKPRVTELLRNLITNAVKYNDKKEKIVEIGRAAENRHGADGHDIPVFYVKDNGKGIAPEFHEEIFRIFKRLQNAAESEDGTGAGLTFVKKIVERHGGKIWLQSQPGQGTTFFFTLEASRDEDQHGSRQAA